jgi:hypothetical protein
MFQAAKLYYSLTCLYNDAVFSQNVPLLSFLKMNGRARTTAIVKHVSGKPKYTLHKSAPRYSVLQSRFEPRIFYMKGRKRNIFKTDRRAEVCSFERMCILNCCRICLGLLQQEFTFSAFAIMKH